MASSLTKMPLSARLVIITALLLLSSPLFGDQLLLVDFSLNDPPTNGGDLPLFWNGSGFNPGHRGNAEFLEAAQHQNMLYLGSVPHGGLRYLRPHYLLDLVDANGLNTDSPTYDWTHLDAFLDIVVASRQALFFQLMGNPGGHFTDFRVAAEINAWKRFVYDLVIHLETRYGATEVRGWFFETWNEPDIDFGWVWDTVEEFYNYYDACSEGLLAADPQLRLGGPGVANPLDDLFEGLVDHSLNGQNYFTGETGVRLDFISYHVKELPAEQVNREISALENLIHNYPSIADTLFVNNESDAECCWWHDWKTFRATPWYAAFIARQVNEHLVRMINGMNLNYRLANDNAFLGWWPNRTHLTRFGDNNSSFALIKKPAHNIMTMLSLLGDRQASVTGYSIKDNIGALASLRGDEQTAILVYYYNDDPAISSTETVSLTINNLPFATGKVAHYRIDKNHGDTYRTWKTIGSPSNPNASELAKLRETQELTLLGGIEDLTATDFTMSFDLPCPGVSLILLSADPGEPPPAVTGVAAERFPSLTPGKEDIVVSWNPTSRVVRTYEILYSPTDAEGSFQRINIPDLIETAFLHPIDKDATAFFKVRAIDYWGRQGPENVVVASSSNVFIVDNTDGGFSSVGDWQTSTHIPGFYGTDYLHDRNADQGTKSARWTPDLPQSGEYEVAIWYPSDAKKATNIPVTINHKNGTETLFLDQNESGSTWVVLGSFTLAAGTGGYVEISNDGTSNYVVADAVRYRLESPVDTDGDGTPDHIDQCFEDPHKIHPGVCGCDVLDIDSDGDGILDCNDRCPRDPNKTEEGFCGCEVADTDTDSDGVADCNDNCPNDPEKTNPGVCGCGVVDIDTDNDGTLDCLESCGNDPNKTQPGTCGCGVTDTDTDKDGVANCNDNCPNDPEKTQPGTCGCGILDVDTDKDGILDCKDNCDSSLDSDGDGIGDCDENCPYDKNKTELGICGCGISDTDVDGDDTPDCVDNCPNDRNKLAPGECGCNISDSDNDSDKVVDCKDSDDDNDGIPDIEDKFPLDDTESLDTDKDGTGNNADTDDDNDGISDQEENAGMNNGDSNDDGILDSLQSNVSSFRSCNGEDYIILESSDGTNLTNCRCSDVPLIHPPPDGLFDYGLFEFTLNGIAAGGSTIVTLILPDDHPVIETYYRWGPTPDDLNHHWYEFLYDGEIGAEIDNENGIITLHFVDGERGDDDLTANGTIVDIGGPARTDDSACCSGGGGGGCFISTMNL